VPEKSYIDKNYIYAYLKVSSTDIAEHIVHLKSVLVNYRVTGQLQSLYSILQLICNGISIGINCEDIFRSFFEFNPYY